MKHMVLLTKDEYDILIAKLHTIKYEVQRMTPCYSASELAYAVEDMEKILYADDEER